METCRANGKYGYGLSIPSRGFLEKLHSLADPQSTKIEEAKIFACSKLLELTNQWAQQAAELAKEEGNEANSIPLIIDQKSFVETLIITQICINEPDEFVFWFNCKNEMFTDHGILVSGDIENDFMDADIV